MKHLMASACITEVLLTVVSLALAALLAGCSAQAAPAFQPETLRMPTETDHLNVRPVRPVGR